MPRRIIDVDGERWTVSVSGRVTQYTKDEFGLVFKRISPAPAEVRTTRYAPLGDKRRETSLARLSDQDLLRLFVHSQPARMSPELAYRQGPGPAPQHFPETLPEKSY